MSGYVLILRKNDYRRGAVDFNNFFNNLISIQSKQQIVMASIVLYRDGSVIKLVKSRHPVDQSPALLVELRLNGATNPQEIIDEFIKRQGLNSYTGDVVGID